MSKFGFVWLCLLTACVLFWVGVGLLVKAVVS